MTDPAGGITQFFYDPFGNLTYSLAPGSYQEHIGYDRRGRKTLLESPDAGDWTYTYNGLGELTQQAVGATNQVTQMLYDSLGRMVERREYAGSVGSSNPFVTNWSYDRYVDNSACSKGTGKLCEVRTGATIGNAAANVATIERTSYDAAGRATQTLTQVDGKAFLSTVAYDAFSRITDPELSERTSGAARVYKLERTAQAGQQQRHRHDLLERDCAQRRWQSQFNAAGTGRRRLWRHRHHQVL